MPSRKGKATGSNTSAQTQATTEESISFPFARYTSIVGVHTSLLAFCALLLPGTSPSFFTSWSISNTNDVQTLRDIVEILTENPVRTVGWTCAGAFVVQSWWASWMRKWSLEGQTRRIGSEDPLQRHADSDEWKKQRVVVYGRAAATTLVASLAFYAINILFGAPFSSQPLHTYALSLLLAILTVLPPAYTFGPPLFGPGSPALVSRLTWVRLFAEFSPRTPAERALVYPAVGAIVGCWAGAIPIGLDWERPWQAWPLTPTFGAVGGFIAGSLVALVVSAIVELAKADRQAQQTQARPTDVKFNKRT